MSLPEPVKVSPLIKLARYVFLISGIIYGASKLKVLKQIVSSQKEEKERIKKERELKMAEEKRMASEKDIADIAAMFGGQTDSLQPNSPEAEDPAVVQSQTAEKKEKTAEHVDEAGYIIVESIPNVEQFPNEEDKSKERNDYYVETFSEGVPYASPKKEQTDFLPK